STSGPGGRGARRPDRRGSCDASRTPREFGPLAGSHYNMDAMNGERKLAMFIDFENIARGVKEAQYKQFELKLVLERLLEKGKITRVHGPQGHRNGDAGESRRDPDRR